MQARCERQICGSNVHLAHDGDRAVTDSLTIGDRSEGLSLYAGIRTKGVRGNG